MNKMEEVAIPKKTKCRNILGWLKQIYYILCWIFIAMFGNVCQIWNICRKN